MILQRDNIAELSHLLACANTRGEKVSAVNLSALNRLLEHKAEGMTATVEAGMTLAEFQKHLAKLGQWLPIDPPHADQLTIGDLLARNLSGPRRFGYGTIGDYLIGLKVVLADGRVIFSGGKVVKNVAGYDLAKLFIGGCGSLGVIVEATFKLRPLPEAETFIAKKCDLLNEADALIERVLESELAPIVFDLHNLSTLSSSTLILGFAGTREEVDWQTTKALELGFNETASLSYDSEFWKNKAAVHRLSVLPSKAIEIIKSSIASVPFVARAGNGIIYFCDAAGLHKRAAELHSAESQSDRAREIVGPNGESAPDCRVELGSTFPNGPATKLMHRLKNEFDPKNIFPELPL